MTTPCAVDYAWSHPNPSAIKAAGYIGVLRYLSNDATKNISAPERDALFAAGLGIRLVWETTATRAGEGFAAGAADAQAARLQANAVGFPASIALYYAVDEQVPWATVSAYFAGAASVATQQLVRLYGSYELVEAAAAAGFGSDHWQTEAWSGTAVSSHAALYQRVAPTLPTIAGAQGSYDENAVLGALAWWGTVVPTPAPAPTPPPAPQPAPTPAPGPQEVSVNVPQLSYTGGTNYQSGQWVRVVQWRCGVNSDGLYGPGTKSAVMRFQAAHGLTPDGIVGANTANAIANGA